MSYLTYQGKMVQWNHKYVISSAQESIYDYDGNLYTYVTIGTQQWLVQV